MSGGLQQQPFNGWHPNGNGMQQMPPANGGGFAPFTPANPAGLIAAPPGTPPWQPVNSQPQPINTLAGIQQQRSQQPPFLFSRLMGSR